MSPSALSDQSSTNSSKLPPHLYNLYDSASLSEFKQICSKTTDPALYPLSSTVVKNVPVYDASALRSNVKSIPAAQREWNHILLSGPGVFIVKGLVADRTVIEGANSTFRTMIENEKLSSTGRGDHFAAAGGKNDRIWNSFTKHGLTAPENFVQYYSNPLLAAICEAWLGPCFRLTSQVNIVNPGGAPQTAHRDYHLGFQSAEAVARFPIAMQRASQLLTLQGAIAHSDMPELSGPTRLLPFSQTFDAGYVAYTRPEFTEYFNDNWVSTSLAQGDGLFFNPALFHAAGRNDTAEVARSANLLQISSAFGKPMESLDSLSVIRSTWEALTANVAKGGLTEEAKAFVGFVAEGYSFPVNLDKRPPRAGGMAPESELELCLRALQDEWTVGRVVSELENLNEGSKA